MEYRAMSPHVDFLTHEYSVGITTSWDSDIEIFGRRTFLPVCLSSSPCPSISTRYHCFSLTTVQDTQNVQLTGVMVCSFNQTTDRALRMAVSGLGKFSVCTINTPGPQGLNPNDIQ